MTSLFAITTVALAGWFWLINMRTREIATQIAVETCRQKQVQFLDATVALEGMRPTRAASGRMKLRRIYRFEYHDHDDQRHTARITMLGTTVEVLEMAGERWIMN